jgi:hypothetical protein
LDTLPAAGYHPWQSIFLLAHVTVVAVKPLSAAGFKGFLTAEILPLTP